MSGEKVTATELNNTGIFAFLSGRYRSRSFPSAEGLPLNCLSMCFLRILRTRERGPLCSGKFLSAGTCEGDGQYMCMRQVLSGVCGAEARKSNMPSYENRNARGRIASFLRRSANTGSRSLACFAVGLPDGTGFHAEDTKKGHRERASSYFAIPFLICSGLCIEIFLSLRFHRGRTSRCRRSRSEIR